MLVFKLHGENIILIIRIYIRSDLVKLWSSIMAKIKSTKRIIKVWIQYSTNNDNNYY